MVRVAALAVLAVVVEIESVVEDEREGGGEDGLVWERFGLFDGGRSEGGRVGGERCAAEDLELWGSWMPSEGRERETLRVL